MDEEDVTILRKTWRGLCLPRRTERTVRVTARPKPLLYTVALLYTLLYTGSSSTVLLLISLTIPTMSLAIWKALWVKQRTKYIPSPHGVYHESHR